MEPVKIGLMGLGTVGGGTATVLMRNAERVATLYHKGVVVRAEQRPCSIGNLINPLGNDEVLRESNHLT